jgi:hypothetical protein
MEVAMDLEFKNGLILSALYTLKCILALVAFYITLSVHLAF